VLPVFQHLPTSPILAIASAAEKIGISFPAVSNSVEHLEQFGILKEITGRQRSRLFVYDGYLSILGEGTEPLRP
jgi:DNA-binding Lrp family transcriptional regulator